MLVNNKSISVDDVSVILVDVLITWSSLYKHFFRYKLSVYSASTEDFCSIVEYRYLAGFLTTAI